jgi:hypothetical protein
MLLSCRCTSARKEYSALTAFGNPMVEELAA